MKVWVIGSWLYNKQASNNNYWILKSLWDDFVATLRCLVPNPHLIWLSFTFWKQEHMCGIETQKTIYLSGKRHFYYPGNKYADRIWFLGEFIPNTGCIWINNPRQKSWDTKQVLPSPHFSVLITQCWYKGMEDFCMIELNCPSYFWLGLYRNWYSKVAKKFHWGVICELQR